MPIQTACPKCQKSYNLADNFAGKAVKCQACGSPFMVASPMANVAQAGRAVPPTRSDGSSKPPPVTGAKAEASKIGVDVPIVRKSTDIFSGNVTGSAGGPDPLANHVVGDPGFTVAGGKGKRKRSKKSDVAAPPDPTPSATPKAAQSLGQHPSFDNPFLASLAASRKANPIVAKETASKKERLMLIGTHHKRMLWSFLLGILLPFLVIGVVGLVVWLMFSSFDINAGITEYFGLATGYFYTIVAIVSAAVILSLVLSVFLVIASYCLAKALWPNTSKATIFLISQFVPIWNLIALFQLDWHARKELRGAGLIVDLLGLRTEM